MQNLDQHLITNRLHVRILFSFTFSGMLFIALRRIITEHKSKAIASVCFLQSPVSAYIAVYFNTQFECQNRISNIEVAFTDSVRMSK